MSFGRSWFVDGAFLVVLVKVPLRLDGLGYRDSDMVRNMDIEEAKGDGLQGAPGAWGPKVPEELH